MVNLETKNSYLWAKHFPDKLYRILAFLSKNGKEAQLSEIKKEFEEQISKPVINDIIFDLKMQNFVKEERMKDKRKKLIKLTENGELLKQKLDELSEIM
ncbi:MAG: hypothetical protein ACTSYB_17160 [Candidatus Helarchaeota archaeon]